MTTPALVPLTEHHEGATWKGIASIGPVKVNGVDPAFGAEMAWMEFRRGSDKGPLLARFSTDTGETDSLPVTQAAPGVWAFVVPPANADVFPAREGEYHWDFWVRDAAGVDNKVYYGVLTVRSSASRRPA